MARQLGTLIFLGVAWASSAELFDFSLAKLAPHTVDGFGCMLWADQTFAIEELKALNIRYIRTTQDNTNFEQMRALRNITDSLDIKWLYVLWRAPQNYTTFRQLTEVDGFATYWVQLVASLDKEGVCPHYLDLMNEPNSLGVWSTGISPIHYNELVKAVRRKLDTAGFRHVGIVGPGTAVMTGSENWIKQLDAEALSSLSAFAVHAWDDGILCHGGASCTVPTWKRTFGAATAAADPKKIWVTEYATQEKLYNGSRYASPDQTPGFSSTATMAFAAKTAQNTLALLNSGASVPFYWEAEDERAGVDSDHNKSWGFVNRRGERRPIYHVLRELYSRIPPGARVVVPPPPPPMGTDGLYAAGFVTESLLVIAMANTASVAMDSSVRVWGGGDELRVQEAVAVVLGTKGDMAKEQDDTAKVLTVKPQLEKVSGDMYAFNSTVPGFSTLTVVLDWSSTAVLV